MIDKLRTSWAIRVVYPYLKHFLDFFSFQNIENKQLRFFIQSVKPDCIIDIGANLGQFIVETDLAKYRGKYLAIEPIAAFHQNYKNLHDFSDFESLIIAISNSDSIKTLNVSNDSGMSSSLLRMHSNFELLNNKINFIATQEVKTIPLAQIINDYCNQDKRILIKIDVQGYEYEVIESLSIQHNNVVAMIIETSFIDLYDHGGRMSEVVNSLFEKGFQVISVKEKGYIPSLKRFSYCDLYVSRS